MSSKSVDQSTHDYSFNKERNKVRRAVVKFFMNSIRTKMQFDMTEVHNLLKELQEEHKISISLQINSNSWMQQGNAKYKNTFTLSVYYAKNPSMYVELGKVPNSRTKIIFYAQGETNTPVSESFNGKVPDKMNWTQGAMSVLHGMSSKLDGKETIFDMGDNNDCTVYYRYKDSYYRPVLPTKIVLEWTPQGLKSTYEEYKHGNVLYVPVEQNKEYQRLPRNLKAFEYEMRTGETV